MLPTESFLLSTLCASLFIRTISNRRQWARDLVVAWLIGISVLYAWHRYAVVAPFDMYSPASYWQSSFALTEGIALLYEMWSFWVLRQVTDLSSEADIGEATLRQMPAASLPSVAVFIPTYNEPAKLVIASLQSALQIEYGGEIRIYCLDDGGHESKLKRRHNESETSHKERNQRSFDLRCFCREHGIVYLARSGKDRGKAGNLAHAYSNSHEDAIVVLDCDFQVDSKRFLWRTLGLLLSDPGTGIVQVPQTFSNPCPFANGLKSPEGICDSQTSFMRVVQSGRDNYQNAFCVGSGWVTGSSTWTHLYSG
jgi:cellulose synthase (UDP-forming)